MLAAMETVDFEREEFARHGAVMVPSPPTK